MGTEVDSRLAGKSANHSADIIYDLRWLTPMLIDIQNFFMLKSSENKKMAVASVRDVRLMKGCLQPLLASKMISFYRTGRLG